MHVRAHWDLVSACFARKMKIVGKTKNKPAILTFPTTSTGETYQSTCCLDILEMAPHLGSQGQIYLR